MKAKPITLLNVSKIVTIDIEESRLIDKMYEPSIEF